MDNFTSSQPLKSAIVITAHPELKKPEADADTIIEISARNDSTRIPLGVQLEFYNVSLENYDNRIEGIHAVSIYIMSTVDKNILWEIIDLQPREQLKYLKENYSPTTAFREQEAQAKYRKLQDRPPRGMCLISWVGQWQAVTRVILKLYPVAKEEELTRDFVRTVGLFDVSWSTFWGCTLRMGTKRTFEEVTADFIQHYKENYAFQNRQPFCNASKVNSPKKNYKRKPGRKPAKK